MNDISWGSFVIVRTGGRQKQRRFVRKRHSRECEWLFRGEHET